MNTPHPKTAILVTDWRRAQSADPQLTRTRLLLPLIDKPMLQLAVERLVNLGCQEFHVLLGEEPTAIRQFLDAGERWGIKVTHHYRNPNLDLAGNLKHLPIAPGGKYWLSCPEMLPADLSTCSAIESHSGPGAALCWNSEGSVHWSGWGCFNGAWLASLRELHEFADVEQCVINDRQLSLRTIARPLSVTTDGEFLRSALQCLNDRSATSPHSPFIGRGAIVHPTVAITGPVHVGKQARIEAGAKLGPNVIVCDGAVVDRGAELVNSIVLPDTYVGACLELNLIIAAPGKLSSIANNVVLNRIEPGLLASISGSREGTRTSSWSVVAAAFAKAVLFPLRMLTRMVSQIAGLKAPDVRTMQVPSQSIDGSDGQGERIRVANTLSAIHLQDRGAWVSHFLHTFYPGLSELPSGHVSLCGPELREVAEVARLPDHWKSLYRQHACGLLSESLLMPFEAGNHFGRYACDAYAVADDSATYQRRLLMRYLSFVCADCYRTLFSH